MSKKDRNFLIVCAILALILWWLFRDRLREWVHSTITYESVVEQQTGE